MVRARPTARPATPVCIPCRSRATKHATCSSRSSWIKRRRAKWSPDSTMASPASFARSFVFVLCVLSVAAGAAAQEPPGPQNTTAAQLQAAIDKLGSLEYTTRTNASRVVRRTASAQAVPALLRAVTDHADGYVRYRALVLLTAFNDPRTKDAMRESLASPNDRLRAVAYSYFEHNPDKAILPDLLGALEKEQAEFVRPNLIRALAAN